MLMKQIIDAYEVLDSSFVTGEAVKEYLLGIKADANVEVYELVGPKGSTDMLKVRIPGKNGKTNGGDAPTIGLTWKTWWNRCTSGTYRIRIRW